MKTKVLTLAFLAASLAFTSCGGEEKKEEHSDDAAPKTEEKVEETTETPVEAPVEETTEVAAADLDLTAGEEVYTTVCTACHQADGNGLAGAFPPLAGSDYLMADKERAIKQVINGSEGEIVVNGETYNGVMPPQGEALNDQQIADVLNYVYHSWGNEGEVVTPEEVAAAR